MNFDPDSTAVFDANLDLSVMPRVLLVDDDELILERLRALIDAAGFEVEAVRDAGAALDCLKRDFSPIVIMDRRMPGMDGLALCRAVRQQSWPGYVYILLLTAQDSEEDILAGLDAGADDYLGKKTSPAQLLARLRTARRILSLEHSLRNAVNEKRRLSLTDPLTGAANRRYFIKHLSRELERIRRSGGALTLLCLDIDHFKRINDQHGHSAGDAVLQEFVQRVSDVLRRETDWCARMGGEEFAVVLSDTGAAGAMHVAEAIRASIAAAPMKNGTADIAVTVSIGVSTCKSTPGGNLPTVELLLQQGDEALYASKARGRNCVTQADRPARG